MRKWLILGVLSLALGAAGWGIQSGRIDPQSIRDVVASKGSKAAVPPATTTAKKPVSVEVTEVKLGPISTRPADAERPVAGLCPRSRHRDGATVQHRHGG
jgi:hypothetical protein